jgi:hypothetical membrane protein
MRDQLRLGAVFWVLTLEFFVAQFVAQWAAPGYDLFRYDISLLGISTCDVFPAATSGSTDVVCSPLHLVFNAGIILHGLFSILGIWLTRHSWPLDRRASFGLVLMALGGAGAMVVGAFPIDDHLLLHVVGAVFAIAAPGLGFLLLARSLWHSHPTLAKWTAGAGIIVLLSGLGHAIGGQPFGRGTMERLAVWPQTLWYFGVGMALLMTRLNLKHSVPE